MLPAVVDKLVPDIEWFLKHMLEFGIVFDTPYTVNVYVKYVQVYGVCVFVCTSIPECVENIHRTWNMEHENDSTFEIYEYWLIENDLGLQCDNGLMPACNQKFQMLIDIVPEFKFHLTLAPNKFVGQVIIP